MKKKLIIGGIIVVIVLIFVIVSVLQKDKGKEVTIKIAEKGNIVSRVTASGTLRAKSQVDISSEMIGRIKKIRYQEGDFVKKGALLIELDDVKAEANQRLAGLQMKQAEQEMERGRQLFEKKLISQESFEKIALTYQAAKVTYQQAQDSYAKTKIYAPISGKVMKINVEEGETAVMGTMNYQGTVMMTIADLSSMIAVVRIDETDVPDVFAGQSAEVIADAMPDSIFKAMVNKVGLMPITSQLSTEQVTDFEVEIEMHEFSTMLRPGMNVKADIITDEKDSILVVPIQASGKRKIKDKNVESVFIAEKSKAVLKEVTTGLSSDTEIEILSGIEIGDTVITGPYRVLSKLKDGQAVNFKIEEDSISTSSLKIKPRRILRFGRRRG
ncbi:hypothetical protein A2Y85_00495 [candidate division WOR-3 bacterium RBG_13_43_14]|uniref:Uncharacterized protein n=1 Tax=candidate division WOR-3 bacterium RBG_13_43_14 TaxID=1802590 RepID=A0A1F4U8K4_UNCW3|nr:MAG: hypothetical protein A2Y85_00495 [candidate division WOR-3 bacterium RBG_13_43_14]